MARKPTTRIHTIRFEQSDFDLIVQIKGMAYLNKLLKKSARREAAKIKKDGKQISGVGH